MTRVEALKLVKILQDAYGREEFSEGRIRIYVAMLQDLPYPLAQRAVYRLLATVRWVPTIAEIREAALAESEHALPDVDSAYQEALQAARTYGSPAGPWHWSHPLIQRAVEAIGGIRVLAYTEEPTVVAAHFRAAYERLRKRAAEDLLVPKCRLALPARERHALARELARAWRVDEPAVPEPDKSLQDDGHYPWAEEAP